MHLMDRLYAKHLRAIRIASIPCLIAAPLTLAYVLQVFAAEVSAVAAGAILVSWIVAALGPLSLYDFPSKGPKSKQRDRYTEPDQR